MMHGSVYIGQLQSARNNASYIMLPIARILRSVGSASVRLGGRMYIRGMDIYP